jgi:hypothetical protein
MAFLVATSSRFFNRDDVAAAPNGPQTAAVWKPRD